MVKVAGSKENMDNGNLEVAWSITQVSQSCGLKFDYENVLSVPGS